VSVRRHWGDYTSREFDGLDPDKVVAVLPIAAIEQHGPHLPVSTDETIMQGLLAASLSRLPDTVDVRALPVQSVGKSNEHIRHPGTLTVPATVLIEHWCAIGESVARAGVRKLVMVNSHGGNEELMGIVARELRARHDLLVVKTSWMRFGTPHGLLDPHESTYGIHGGDYETSVMLALAPELVDMAQAARFASVAQRAHEKLQHIAPTGAHAWAWLAEDLNPEGVVGDASSATAERGQACIDHQSAGFAALLEQVCALRVADWLADSAR